MYAMSASEYYNDKVVVDWSTDESSLGLMDQLYTARGSQGQAIGAYFADRYISKPDDWRNYFLFTTTAFDVETFQRLED